MTTDTIPHGMPPGYKAPIGYMVHGCRCDECKEARRAYFDEWFRKNPDAKVRRSRSHKRRCLEWVMCVACGWTSRRGSDVRYLRFDAYDVTAKPCPQCGGRVTDRGITRKMWDAGRPIGSRA